MCLSKFNPQTTRRRHKKNPHKWEQLRMSFCLYHTFSIVCSSEKHRKTQSIIWVHSATTSQSCDFLLNLVVSDTLWDPGRGSAGVFQSIRLLFTRIGKFEPPLLLVQRPVPLCMERSQCLIPQKWVQTVALFMPLFPQSFPAQLLWSPVFISVP